MKKLCVLLSIGLTGCAGMNTEFENAIPAKDSGFWLQQADEMGNINNGDSKSDDIAIGSSSYVDVKKYKLLDTGNIRLPVKMLNTDLPDFQQNNSNSNFQGNVVSGFESSLSDFCSAKNCYPEPSSPLRKSEQTARMWLAPYVSPDNNAHLGEIVYFIAKQPTWSGIEKDKK